MKSFKKAYTVKAGKKLVWQALTDCELIEKWSRGPCEMADSENFEFSLWGGQIFGTNTEVQLEKKLVQDWFAGDWPEPSIVVFDIKEKNGKTHISIDHTNIPDNEYDEIKEGWDKYFMRPLTALVEKLNSK